MAQERSVYLGIDVGSVSTNLVLLESDTLEVVQSQYLRTQGKPMQVLQEGLAALQQLGSWNVLGVGATGSARQLAGVMVGADVVKNEITAHAVAASHQVEDPQTILEIGGQDSKIIILRQGVVTDFAMNTVCAAGTGSFLDQQASRLGIPIAEFGDLAVKSRNAVRIAGRCTVFAESDMIHKQQLGHGLPDILAGLCTAMVRNYLNNVGKGKEIQEPIVFQGGVAANQGMRRAFEEELGVPVCVPPHYDVMGALGAAVLAAEAAVQAKRPTRFLGFSVADSEFGTDSWECQECPNRCEIIQIRKDGQVMASFGARCGGTSKQAGRTASDVAIS